MDQAPAPAACLYCGTTPPYIELKVHSKSKKKGSKKFKPDKLSWLKIHNVWLTCTHVDGYGDYLTAGSGHGSGTDYVLRYDERVKVKKRKFSIDDSDEGLTMTGRVPRKGPATGTLRFAIHQSPQADPYGEILFPGRDCTSPTLSWSADKQ